MVQAKDNQRIIAEPTMEEMREATLSIPSSNGPGPNGFGFSFYIACWSIIKEDMLEAVKDFFRGVELPRAFTSSHVVLILKVEKPSGFDKFRSITLCSVFYKICSKIIVSRLSHLLPKMISLEQGAFIPGRSIFENITLTQEMCHSINRKAVGGNVLVKIDMAKAYDRVDWGFLLHVLAAFGVSPQVCRLIEGCIFTPWYSIVMYGTARGFFRGEKGLCQGDPLSP